jgi:hypothetical protein
MNVFSLFAFKLLVNACVNVLLLSSDTAISDLTMFRIPRIKKVVVATSDCVNWYVVVTNILVQTRV